MGNSRQDVTCSNRTGSNEIVRNCIKTDFDFVKAILNMIFCEFVRFMCLVLLHLNFCASGLTENTP